MRAVVHLHQLNHPKAACRSKSSVLLTIFSVVVLASLVGLGDSNDSSVANEDGTTTHHLQFKVQYTNVTRLGHTKRLVSVNGQFPGPTVYVRQGDRVYVKVSNYVSDNVSIHWHGVRQMFSVWADGPAYITQCPLKPGAHYTHNFTVVRESGTLFWHAHISWLRATLYGAFIILPKANASPLPFPIESPHELESPILLGEWWNRDVLDVEKYGLADGGGYNLSDALTINGQPGLLYNCSQQDTTVLHVKKGETYILRIINAAMNFQMFFGIAMHRLTVVETDCSFSKPYTTDVMLLAPGQTADVLLTADQQPNDYVMGAAVYSPARGDYVPFPNITTTAILRYVVDAHDETKGQSLDLPAIDLAQLDFPNLPAAHDSDYASNYVKSLRSLNSKEHPSRVPGALDRSFLFTAGYAIQDCEPGHVCHGPGGQKVSTSVNNITFVSPTVSILQAYYESIRNYSLPGLLWDGPGTHSTSDVYQEDFPSMPLFQYNYTGMSFDNKHAMLGTKVKVLDFKSNVQLVLQDTQTLFFESHPFHLHGYNFYIVGMGEGSYDSEKDPAKFNLVDPPAMNTVSVPAGGWVAVRFLADNPGVWLMHCHFEMHTSWGMQMVWIVKEGEAAHEKLPPPPQDYPRC